MNSCEIRVLKTIDELDDVRRLESKIWGQEDSVPVHQTLTAVKNGGLMLGAYTEGRLSGFQYSFPGYDGRKVYLCSHMLGTDPAVRNKGIGEKLKLAQKQEALKMGYSLITWTYDPLESVNGYLNIGKLGGMCSTYIENCYGDLNDLLNGGLPTDRFLVEWHITGENEHQSIYTPHRLEPLLEWELNTAGIPIPGLQTPLPEASDGTIYVPIPSNFQHIREKDPAAALLWRLKTREIFQNLFARGWQIEGFVKNSGKTGAVHHYALKHKGGKGHEDR
ncbi:GNAT family N-acetyltransferase [Peribacillus sp. SCS-37]|uniref:GNAT family N-acetyltransferase n=1 Tax=Paraperibacillus esterisolvens TaxID=3115296 RepID=UPI003906BB5A